MNKKTTLRGRGFSAGALAVFVAFSAFVALAALSGCSPALVQRSAKDIALPDSYMGVRAATALDGGDGATQAFVSGQDPDTNWWHRFGSQPLNDLIETALRDSPSLRSAELRLGEAGKYLAAQQGTSNYPRIDLDVSAKREQVNTAAIGLPMIPNPKPFTLYNTGLSISYDFDIFGAQRHRVAAKRYEVAIKRYEAQAARLALASNIVTAAIREGYLRDQIDLKDALLGNRQAISRTLNGRYAHGTAAYKDVLDSDLDVDRAQAELPALRTSLAQVRSQLAVYAGVSSPASLPEFHLRDLQLPESLSLTVPSELAHQRPDILAAEASLQVAGELAGVAAANLYPQFDLSADIASTPLVLGRMFAGGTNIWSFGAQMSAPLFRGGELRAKRDAAYAEYDAAFQDYKDVVLKALQSVADAMSAIEQDASASKTYVASQERHEKLVNMTNDQLKLGSKDILDVLQAQQAYDLSSLEVMRLRANRLTNTASFFSAIGAR
ncbi:efflux transporter outer membrane subunit [Paraburkholderia bryophila]|uniref:NodT family efflux transporter outer membrane factor (OMF) lipoprotein n=1 Tax=Paraburkholderia bryophila TaxID=420952 RepID=A0A329BFG9_9BURK|nr:efflux transporter outer membrane subunit [Paraburkholderia bryophila]RAS15790.1 NodT family efflux transporter outer membrane factor (OMF) lipoprotein [Paraburkholderia bryophila]